MRSILYKWAWAVFGLSFPLILQAQSSAFCGGGAAVSTSVASVYFFQNTPITVNGDPIEPGSHIIAVFENDAGEWACAGEVQWWGSNTILTLRGEDAEYEGYEEGEALKFYIQSPDGCLYTAVEAAYNTAPPYPDGGFFTQGGRSLVESLSADFNPLVIYGVVRDTCEAGTGQARIAAVDGSTAGFSVTWPNGSSGQQVSGLTAGPITASITTAEGCTVEQLIQIPFADCPLLTAGATANGSQEGSTGCVPFNVLFEDATVSAVGGLSYEWEFGDGSVSNDPNPDFTYALPGTYTATLVVSDGYQSDTTTLQITALPIPEIGADYEVDFCEPVAYLYAFGDLSEITVLEWSTSVGTFAGPEPVVQFPSAGVTEVVLLTAFNNQGCSYQFQFEVNLPEEYDLAVAENTVQLPACGADDGVISLSVSGGTGPYLYSWAHDATLNQPQADGLAPGGYSVVVSDANGCSVGFSTALADTTSLPEPDIGPDRSFCADMLSALELNEGYSSTQWFFEGAPLGEGGETSWLPQQSGTYAVQVFNADGCQGEAAAEVSIFEVPEVDLGGSFGLCPGMMSTIGTSCSGCTYAWSNGSESAMVSATGGNTYAVTVTNADGCAAADSLAVALLLQPQANLGADLAVCPGDVATLSAGASPDDTYSWSTGATSSSIEAAAPGEYGVTVTNPSGCSASDTIQLSWAPEITASVSASSEQLCPGDTLALFGGGAENVLWLDTSFVISSPNEPTVRLQPETTASYGLIAYNDCFTDTAFIEVAVLQQSAYASEDTCIAYRRTAVLQALGADSASWWGTDRQKLLSQGLRYEVSPDSTSLFHVRLTDSLGCMYWDSVLVEILFLDELGLVPVNIITPNGDGLNDVLQFANLTKFDTYSLQVFNRHGMKVFDAFNYENDWGGTYNGEPLPDGVYYYILRIGSREVKSALTIIRE